MARSVRSTPLETRTGRFKLAAGTRHAITIGKGLILVYRRGPRSSTWHAKIRGEDGRYSLHALGQADDRRDANGAEVLDFFQAQDRAREQVEQVKRRRVNARKTATVHHAAARYLDWYKENRKAYRATKATVEAHILPSLGNRSLEDLTAEDLKHWRDRIASAPPRRRAPSGKARAFREVPLTDDQKRARRASANRIYTVLRAILNKAFEDGLVSNDSAWRRVKCFKGVDEPRIRIPHDGEMTRLINAADEDLRRLICAALFTGGRFGELAALRVADVDLDRATVYFAETKGGRPRHVPLSRHALHFLRPVVAGRPADERVLVRASGRPWAKNDYQRQLGAANTNGRISPPLRFHELRHAFAVALINAGVDLPVIAKLLGHADTRTTVRHYAHLADETLRHAVEKLPAFGIAAETKVETLTAKRKPV